MTNQEQQIQELKNQIINQINSSFPEDKKQEAVSQINAMNNEQFINFLKQNKLIPDSQSTTESIQTPQSSPFSQASQEQGISQQQETPFRQIVNRGIPSYKIDENKECIAVLEINPVSPGHTIIIPKKPVHEAGRIPQPCFSLAKKIAKKIKTKLKPKEVIITSSSVLGEIIINMFPQYKDETLNSQRIKASDEELEKLKKLLEKKPRLGRSRVKKEKIISSKEKKIILPKRIP